MTGQPPPSLGRRLLPALVLTTSAAGLVALLDRPSGGSAIDLAGDAASSPDAAPVTTPNPTPSAATVTPGPAPTISAAAPASPSIVPPQVSSTTLPSVKPPAAAGTCTGPTVDGPTINTRWGPVQVEAVVSSTGQICNVDAIQSPNDHRRSVAINQHALPILHTEVMKAQSANINGVSGATVTSTGYVRSLQAILDGAGG